MGKRKRDKHKQLLGSTGTAALLQSHGQRLKRSIEGNT